MKTNWNLRPLFFNYSNYKRTNKAIETILTPFNVFFNYAYHDLISIFYSYFYCAKSKILIFFNFFNVAYLNELTSYMLRIYFKLLLLIVSITYIKTLRLLAYFMRNYGGLLWIIRAGGGMLKPVRRKRGRLQRRWESAELPTCVFD